MHLRTIFVVVSLAVAALNASGQSFDLDGTTMIKLTISHPTGVVPISFFTCHTFPVFDCAEVRDTISMDQKSVSVNVPVRSLQEGDLTVGDKRLHLLMIPGDTIVIKLTNSTRDAMVDYVGKTKDVQLYYLYKARQFPVSVAQQMMNASASTTTLVDFKAKADILYLQEEKFWKSANDNTITIEGKTVQTKQSLPSWFIRYENDAMRYNNAMNRVYAIGYQEFIMKKKMDIPEGYFDFLKSISLSNELAVHDGAYEMFLLQYFGFKSARGKGNYGHHKEFQLADEALSERVAGFYKLSSISTSLGDSPSNVIQDLDSIKLLATFQHLADYLRKTAEAKVLALSAHDNAPDFFLEDEIDSLVSLSQYKGEVVYLSFWFAGCKPCVEEFPFENDLVKKFEGKPVKIISICTYTNKAKWLEMIKTHKLRMVNLFANKAWGNKIKQSYKIGSYPHYVLIGRNGHVIQNFAKRPREISNEIQKALDQ
ncbi:TlpA family protein disulfide reductase [Chryseolinea lacunae]|uniref:TlpA family protein disulfide reductase n=1 Tax=Chryseolinea lacunae TaxID=2801331 RepID=A0ABS1KQ94_9BACT|nr:TlpA disulfide reductase family protein [Chryseolinea lacunae]MBL0741407.1 TlpA family protein disulfide reductase [Chryseolinea lacunae]